MSGRWSLRGRRYLAAAVGGLLLLSDSGCRHRRVQPLVLPPQTPVALIEVPQPQDETMVKAPDTKLPAVPVAQAAEKPKKVKRRSPKPVSPAAVAPPPQTVAGVSSAKEAGTGTVALKKDATADPVGALTVGGEQSPRALYDARDLIAANERRLNGLSAETVKAQADLVSKAKNFQRDAAQALKSGDAEGAKTLATKGKLLLDDLDKAGSQ